VPAAQAANPLARISHKLRRETPREAGWDKAGAESGEGCMSAYCPNSDSSPTPSQPASRKSQQMACEICGLGSKAAGDAVCHAAASPLRMALSAAALRLRPDLSASNARASCNPGGMRSINFPL
jgi:hypothetical protein